MADMKKQGAARLYPLRVRYAETDQMGIAHHSNYFVWFEEGRSNYCRDMGFPYAEFEKNGVFMPVVEVHCRYKSSLLYDEEALLEIVPDEIGVCSMVFRYRLCHKDGRIAAEGWTKHVFADGEGRLIRRENDVIKRIKALLNPDEGREAKKQKNGERNNETTCSSSLQSEP